MFPADQSRKSEHHMSGTRIAFQADRYRSLDLFVERTGRETRVELEPLDCHFPGGGRRLPAPAPSARTMPADEYRHHFRIGLPSDGAYRLVVTGGRVSVAYLSECEDLLDRGVRYLCPEEGDGRSRSWEPRCHFEPRAHWMNDPNGLCRFQGRYHLFYQYNPYGWQWGNTHWGHAVSRDLVNWTDLPIVLEPQPEIHRDHTLTGGAYSGSAVPVDDQGRPCKGDLASAMRIYLTRHLARVGDPSTVEECQTTCLCVDGIHFGPEQVVVTRPGDAFGPDFRDPKVETSTEREGGDQLMVVATNLPAGVARTALGGKPASAASEAGGAADGQSTAGLATDSEDGWYTTDPTCGPTPRRDDRIPVLAAFRSRGVSLQAVPWEYDGVLLADMGHGESTTYECPDLFRLDGSQMALAGLMQYRDAQGRFQPIRWYAGRLQGGQAGNPEHAGGGASGDAPADSPLTMPARAARLDVMSSGWCDFGSCYYAAQTFEDDLGRRIAIGWLSDWFGVRPRVKGGANGAMSLPRQLRLRGGRLFSKPVSEVYDRLLGATLLQAGGVGGQVSRRVDGSYYVRIDLSGPEDFDLRIATCGKSRLDLVRQGGVTALKTQGAPTDGIDFTSGLDRVDRVEVFQDGDITEVFLNDGEAAGAILFAGDGTGVDDLVGDFAMSADGCTFDVGMRALKPVR